MIEDGGPVQRAAVVTPYVAIPVGIDANQVYAGQTFYFDPQPVFGTLLTNGHDDQIDLFQGFPVSAVITEKSEAEAFFGDVTGAQGVDSSGFIISRVGIRVDSMEVTNDFSVPGGKTFLDITNTVLVEGHPIPEPSIVIMLGVAAGCIAWRRRQMTAMHFGGAMR